MSKERLIYSSSLASSIAIVFVTVITIAAELSASLKKWLTAFSGHHWTSKGILMLAVYALTLAIFYYLFRDVDSLKIREGIWASIWSTVIGALILFLFFTGHHFGLY
ncbi:MAG: hypothetical protein A2909_02350 [Candidatus Tagabacteria bacterium RIFCSPLOWO2_01_FULL_39_11]|uniref:Uncharacterized protein n=1 Tax=Candidatus Tagabacteria bacterium RIFCSPLOWO2_01_FULL_39_11 TaxID=1802295 RepID=A0A1G2LPA5_9BACT|nr:MAG: hypothetical protein A2909_02350 [Candidatus Tagabacteria bacterium RIFCSPLOWO2_01_FULL_39_11]